MAANMWKNSLKNVESDNKIVYETLLDFIYSETVLTFWISLIVFTRQSFCMDIYEIKHQNNMAARFLISYQFSEKRLVLLCKPKCYVHVYETLSPDHTLGRVNPFHSKTMYFLFFY